MNPFSQQISQPLGIPLRLDPMDRITAAEALYLGFKPKAWVSEKKQTSKAFEKRRSNKFDGIVVVLFAWFKTHLFHMFKQKRRLNHWSLQQLIVLTCFKYTSLVLRKKVTKSKLERRNRSEYSNEGSYRELLSGTEHKYSRNEMYVFDVFVDFSFTTLHHAHY